MIRNPQIIGGLWPRCKNCNHIAQAHDDGRCSDIMRGQCPTCKTHGVNIPCDCTRYIGPTLEEFERDYMTPEERAHYNYSGKNQ